MIRPIAALSLSLMIVCPLAAATRDAVPMPPLTMREMAAVQARLVRRSETHEQGRRLPPRTNALTPALEASIAPEAVTTKPSIAAPPLAAGFRGSYDIGFLPSDASGAVSAKYLLATSNCNVTVHDRNGAVLSSVTLAQFWHDPAYVDGALYDTRVAYDATADRWVMVTLYDVNLSNNTLLIAISATGDPAGTWTRSRFIIDPTEFRTADYTRLALTRDSIVITADIYTASFSGTDYANIYTINKAAAFASPALSVTTIRSPFSDVVPVETRDAVSRTYVVSENLGLLIVAAINGPTVSTLGTLNPPFSAQGFPDTEVCPQSGGAALDCGTFFAHNAVLRNGVLWAAGQEYTNERSSVVWWRANVSGTTVTDAGGGAIDDPTGGAMYAFPSIAVNQYGAAAIGYSVFKPSAFPSAGYSYIDASNRLSEPAILKAGEGTYRISRWADFSATVVDPADDTAFWAMQTYTMTPPAGFNSFRWATWWGKIAATGPAPATPSKRRAARH